jgi:hypothetical protein
MCLSVRALSIVVWILVLMVDLVEKKSVNLLQGGEILDHDWI